MSAHRHIVQALNAAIAESVDRGHCIIFRLYSRTRRGVVLDAEWSARHGKVYFIPTMWTDVAGETRVKERPLEEISAERCVEMLLPHAADIEAGNNAMSLSTASV